MYMPMLRFTQNGVIVFQTVVEALFDFCYRVYAQRAFPIYLVNKYTEKIPPLPFFWVNLY